MIKIAEKIIIDGIDVSGCGFYQRVFEKPDRHDPCNQWGDTKLIFCSENPNCDYKQKHRLEAQYNQVVEQNKSLQSELKQKEQECEELKEQVSRCSESWGKASLEKDWYQQAEQAKQEENYNLEMELYRYKQALDEIGRVINSLHYQSLIFHNGKTHELADRIQETKNQILDIINKAKEENNAG